MVLRLHVAVDLGSDTLKIAYAYNVDEVYTGKIVGDPDSMCAIPSVAYYDFDGNNWKYGEEIDRVNSKSFMGVVKIKFLLSLLNGRNGARINASNSAAYFSGHDFPKFYFPVRRKMPADFSKAVASKLTFSVGGVTPQKICENFFAYVGALVNRRAELLAKKLNMSEIQIVPSLLHPQYTTKECVAELERLIEHGFGRRPYKTMSMTKALCAYAMQTKRIKRGESVLIFNIGEEQISVVKASLFKTGLAVDGADGHNDPELIGGNDIDDAVADRLERDMSRRESMGRPSCGEDGYLAEGSLNSKQYLFVKDIKSAKVILGMPLYEKSAFSSGVPICVSRDLYIQRKLTREAFADCIGIYGKESGVAYKILDYIKREVLREVNSNVKKVFLTGGPVETYGLVEFISHNLKKLGRSVYTFENDDESYDGVENDGFNVLSHEDAVYAPSIGCAISALNNIDIKTVLALSYGLRLFLNGGETPYLELLVNKGDVLPPDGAKFFVPRPEEVVGITTIRDSDKSAPMNIMSTLFSREDIAVKKLSHLLKYKTNPDGRSYLKCDTKDRAMMNDLMRYAGVKLLNGSLDNLSGAGVIYYYYNKTRVRVMGEVAAIIGVTIDGEGRAKPFAENDTKRNGKETVIVRYLWDIKRDGVLYKKAGDYDVVHMRDIVFDFDIDDMIFN